MDLGLARSWLCLAWRSRRSEKRSDEAIQLIEGLRRCSGLLRYARNDGGAGV
jgi:hypothetical protein